MAAPRTLVAGLSRRLGLEPEEGSLLLLMGALVATLMCAYTIAKVLRDALFIAEFGALSLPYAYIGVALASVGFVWLEGAVASRFSRVSATRFNQYTAIGFGALAALLLPIARHWTVVWFYLWTGSQAMMLLPHFWGLALNAWDSRRARRIFPILAGCGLIGGLAGGAFSAWSTPLVQRVGLMWIMAALLGAAHLLTLVAERCRAQLPVPVEARSKASRWDILRKSGYIRIFAFTLALSVIVGTLVDFQFKYYIQHLYPDPGALTRFLGKFYVLLNSAALLFQFGAAGWLMQRLGLGAASELQPASIVLLSAWVALSPGWWAIIALRSVQGVVSQSLGKVSTEIYYAAIHPVQRRLVKPAIDTLVERWSDAVAGVLLIFALHALHVSITAIAIGTGVLAGLWVFYSVLLNREFGTAFEKALSSRWIDPEEAPHSMRLSSARRALLAALRSGDEGHIVIALQLSRSTSDPRIAEAVRDCLRHESPGVKLTAVQAMESMRLRDRDGVIEEFLKSEDEGLRRAAVAYLVSLHSQPEEFARRLLDGDDPTLRRHIVDALFERPSAARALTPRWIDARLESGSRDDLLLAARALGAVSGREPARKLLRLLENPDSEVQLEALRSATRRPSPELLDILPKLLSLPELTYQARQALAAVGDAAVPALKRLLEGRDGPRAQDLAARTLAHISTPRSIDALMTLVRSSDVRLRYLGLRGLVRMRAHTGQPVLGRAGAHRMFLRELGDFVHADESAVALERHIKPEIRLLGESYRESAEMALERALQSLSCWYDSRPLAGAFERLKPPIGASASTALEYLGHVLPRAVFKPVHRIFEVGGVPAEDATAGGDELSRRIGQAWASEDDWLRACAVRASRVIEGFDSSLFATGDGGSALVAAELAALPPGAIAPGAARAEARTC